MGEFIPTVDPDRTEVPSAPDIESALKDYKTGLAISQGEAFDPTPANIEKHLIRAKLQNGMKVIMLPKTTRGSTVSAMIQLRFGDEKSLAGKNATADLAGALLMRGTKTKTRQEIQDEMVKLNARINVNGGTSRATATVQTTEANLIPALRLAAEILREPAFPESEFDQAKRQNIAGIESRRTEPAALAPLALERSMNPFPREDVRYVGTVDEQIEDINKVSLDDVKKFHAQFYGASHGELVIIGQFDQAELRKAAEDLLGSWSSPAGYRRITTSYRKTTPINLKIETPDKQNATLDAALAFSMVDTDSGLSSDGAGQLHVRRFYHGTRTQSNSKRGRPELWRQLAILGSGRWKCGHLWRGCYQQSEEHAESGIKLPRRVGEDSR